MKTAIIFSEGIKQIMLTPESAQERTALQMLTADDNVEVAIKSRSSFVSKHEITGFRVGLNQAGYLRAWADEDSVMLVLTPKQKEVNQSGE